MSARDQPSLRQAAAPCLPQRVALRSILQARLGRVDGFWLVLLGTLSVVPVPGLGAVLGIAVTSVALAMWRGRTDNALPDRLGRIEVPRAWAKRVALTMRRFYRLAGGMVQRPRSARAAMSTAVVAGLMGILIFLPIPLGNLLPALSLVCLGMAATRRGRAAVLLGYVLAVLALLWTVALGCGASWLASGWFGDAVAR